MTAVSATPPALEHYLRRATAGLPPAKRQEVWDELEEHVSCRAEQLEWQGAAPEQALAQALAELGPPLRVSAGMNGVHNMPKILSIGGIAALIVTAGLYALAQQTGPTVQIPVRTQVSAVKCVKSTEPQPQLPFLFKSYFGNLCYQDDGKKVEGIYVSLTEAEKVLQPLGFTLSVTDGKVNFYYKPLQKQVVQTNIYFKSGGESYLDAGGDLIPMIMSGFPTPVHLHDAQNPTISIGNLSHIVLTDSAPDLGRKFYERMGQVAGYNLFDLSMQGKYQQFMPEFGEPDLRLPGRAISTGLDAGEVVAAYRWVNAAPKTYGGTTYLVSQLALEMGVTNEQGQVSLHIPESAKFITTPSAQPSQEFLLVRLTNIPIQNLKSGIFLPKP